MDEARKEGEWRKWVEQYTPKFLLFARQKARTEADAQDLVQEAVLEAAQRQPNGGPPPLLPRRHRPRSSPSRSPETTGSR